MANDYRRIELTRGKFALVDYSDFEWLNQWKWFCDSLGYAVRDQHIRMEGKKEIKKRIYMHRLLMDFPEGKEIDHINHDKSDNRKANLRICTRSQNTMNHELHKNNKSGFKGVHRDKSRNRWMVYGTINNRRIHLGRFINIKDALKARAEFEKINFGEYA